MKKTTENLYPETAQPMELYKIPKILFYDPKYGNLSTDAKLLYGIICNTPNLTVEEISRMLRKNSNEISAYAEELKSYSLISESDLKNQEI